MVAISSVPASTPKALGIVTTIELGPATKARTIRILGFCMLMSIVGKYRVYHGMFRSSAKMEQSVRVWSPDGQVNFEKTITKLGTIGVKVEFPGSAGPPGIAYLMGENVSANFGSKGNLQVKYWKEEDHDLFFENFRKGVVFQDGLEHDWLMKDEHFGASFYKSLFLKTLMEKRALELEIRRMKDCAGNAI